MLDWLNAVGEAIATFLDVIVTIFESIVTFFEMAWEGMTFLTYCITLMPHFVVSFATAGIAVCLVLHIIGR